jgi:Do/DeqQ family serine protease
MKNWSVAVVAAAVGALVALTVNEKPVEAQAPVAVQPRAVAPAPRRVVPTGPLAQLSYAPIVERAAPAVVNIYTTKVVRQRNPLMEDPFFRRFFGDQGQPNGNVQGSLGSGVIVRANGLIITNNHVIEGADEIRVSLSDKREFPAQLILTDPRTDIAVLRINPGTRQLPVVRFGDSDNVRVGDVVFAIGNPFDVGQTVTHGIVSALARSSVGVGDYQFFIQTDAAINPGNSGGALINSNGDLIGINTAIYSRSGGSMGIGFAVPVTMVKSVLNSVAAGKVVRPWLGIGGVAVTADKAKALRLDRPVGVLLSRVVPSSPAARAGLRVGDVVYAIDGKEVGDEDGLRFRVATKSPGQSTIITLIRNGQAQNVTATLVAPPEIPARDTTIMRGNNLFQGVQIANLSPAFSQELGGGVPERGIIVLAFANGAPAARFGLLQPGDLFEQINGRAVESVDQLQATLAATTGGFTYRINRGGRAMDCGFRPPSSFYCR